MQPHTDASVALSFVVISFSTRSQCRGAPGALSNLRIQPCNVHTHTHARTHTHTHTHTGVMLVPALWRLGLRRYSTRQRHRHAQHTDIASCPNVQQQQHTHNHSYYTHTHAHTHTHTHTHSMSNVGLLKDELGSGEHDHNV